MNRKRHRGGRDSIAEVNYRYSEGLTAVRKWEAFRLATRSFRSEDEIARELGVSQTTVANYIKAALAEIRDSHVSNVDAAYSAALARMEGVGSKLWNRIEESVSPDLNTDRIRSDIMAGRTTAEAISRYYRNGVVKRKQLSDDVETDSPELAVVEEYIIPGKLDIQASAQYTKVVESMRKLQGIDRDKVRVELTGKEAAVATVNDIQAEIVALARARKEKQNKIIEVAARSAKG